MKTFVYHKKAGTTSSRPATRRPVAVLQAAPIASVDSLPSVSERRVDNGAMQRAMHHARSRQAKRRA